MRNAFFLLIFLSLSLLTNGCARHNVSPTPEYICVAGSQQRPAPSFNGLEIKGNMSVNLTTGCSKPQVIFKGDPRDFANVKTYVSNGTYHIVPGKGYPKCAMRVDVCTHYLNYFRFQGHGEINAPSLNSSVLDVFIENSGRTSLNGHLGIRRLEIKGNGFTQIKGINSRNLQLKISGNPKVQLVGVINISSIDLTTDAILSLYWIKANQLIIREQGRSVVQLAGMVDKLDVELWGASRFRGRYLRANTAFVKTHDNSLAEMSAVKRQHTLASGASDIHFYNIPELKTDFMAFNGAVLDMRDWNNPFMQEYDQYNIGPP
jgi:hypothetical protein